MKNVFVDIHIVQDLPPSNINRDDNGTPKSAVYGGVERLRVSSQAWKRATRLHFRETMEQEQLGLRTRRLLPILSSRLVEAGASEAEALVATEAVLSPLKITGGKKAAESAYLLFFGVSQLDELAGQILATRSEWEGQGDDAIRLAMKGVSAQQILSEGHPLDVALFGRMVADLADLNVDAAAQVAHAISTHAARPQFDYFTAVDDGQEDDETGAGMIGVVEFNAATMYRFASVSTASLFRNLGSVEATVDGIKEFVSSFALAMPEGKKNSFAPRTRPSVVAVVVREDQPVNFVSAFESPIWSNGGLLEKSRAALANFVVDESERWGDTPLWVGASYEAGGDSAADLGKAFGASLPFAELMEGLASAVGDVDE